MKTNNEIISDLTEDMDQLANELSYNKSQRISILYQQQQLDARLHILDERAEALRSMQCDCQNDLNSRLCDLAEIDNDEGTFGC